MEIFRKVWRVVDEAVDVVVFTLVFVLDATIGRVLDKYCNWVEKTQLRKNISAMVSGVLILAGMIFLFDLNGIIFGPYEIDTPVWKHLVAYGLPVCAILAGFINLLFLGFED